MGLTLGGGENNLQFITRITLLGSLVMQELRCKLLGPRKGVLKYRVCFSAFTVWFLPVPEKCGKKSRDARFKM